MKTLKLLAVALAGIMLFALLSQRDIAYAMISKASGGDQPCPWAQLAAFPWTISDFSDLQRQAAAEVKPAQSDRELPIQLMRTSGRDFWIRKSGGDLDGSATLAYVLAEQRWIANHAGQFAVRPGSVVVDVGAHVGTFDDYALRQGAAKTILIEPDPVNVACIRRNFAREIADGRVVVVPEGAWSSRSTLTFSTGVANSGTGSFVIREKGNQQISVPVRPLDDILAELGVSRVDFIKMDIEGAEREALRGASRTLARDKPILMLDQYHLPDDSAVLPRIIAQGHSGYRSQCTLCSPDRMGAAERIVPYAVFYY
jgi:FkbM family methyltransferase